MVNLSPKTVFVLLFGVTVVIGVASSGSLFGPDEPGPTMPTPTVESTPTATLTTTQTASPATEQVPQATGSRPFSRMNAPDTLDGTTDWEALRSAHQHQVRDSGGASFTYRESKADANETYRSTFSVTHTTNTRTGRMYRNNTSSSGSIETIQQYNEPGTRHAYAVFNAGDKTYEDVVHDTVGDGDTYNLTTSTDAVAWGGTIIFDTLDSVTWTYAGHEETGGGTTVAVYTASTATPDPSIVSGRLRISANGVVTNATLTKRTDRSEEWKTTFELVTGPQPVSQPDWTTKPHGRHVVESE